MNITDYDLLFGPIPQHRFFTTRDLVIPDNSSSRFEKVIKKDNRFIFLRKEGELEYFILKKTLFVWLINLNLNLARASQSRLNCRKFLALLNHLHPEGGLYEIPKEILQFGSKYGLVHKSYFDDILVFPLAFLFCHTISYSAYSKELISEIMNLSNGVVREIDSVETILQELFSKFDERINYIVLSREGILTGDKKTLEEIGEDLKITRERVRQIEDEFWRRARHSTNRRIVFKALLTDFIHNKGKLVYRGNKKMRSYRHFLIKYIKIPYVYLPKENLTFLGLESTVIDEFQYSELLEEKILSRKGISKFIHRVSKLDYSKEDFKIFRRIILLKRRDRLTKTKRVYVALNKIGKPAHYSIVAREYQKLYPNDEMTEHNIHAILSGRDKFVWIGIKGTYALKEWGYKKPDKTLFETIEEIVIKVYTKTRRPVHVSVINAELGKYRRIVNPVSVAHVLGYSNNLKKVGTDLYLPTSKKKIKKSIDSFSDLDKILSKFQSKNL